MNKSTELFRHYGNGTFAGRDTLSEILRLDLLSALADNADKDIAAIKYSKKSCELKENYFGKGNEIYLNSLLDVSKMYAERLKYTSSSEIHNKAYDSYIEMIKHNFCSMSEGERDSYWKKANLYFERTLMLAYRSCKKLHGGNDHSLSGSAYNTLLLSKGLLLNSSVDFENYILNSNVPSAINTLNLRQEYKSQGKSQDFIDSLDYIILDDLKRSGKEYNIPKLGAKWQDVAECLGDEDVAIEFFRTYQNDYGAAIIKKDWKRPRIIRLKETLLFNQQDYTLDDALIYAIRNLEYEVTSRYNADSESEAIKLEGDLTTALSKAIWTKELMKYFPKSKDGKIYFAADGNLQLYGIENLPLRNIKEGFDYTTLSDAFRMYRLSSTRVLPTAVQNSIDRSKQAVLYGGLDYQLPDTTMIAESNAYAHKGEAPRIKELPAYIKEMTSANNQRGINRYIKREGEQTYIEPLQGTLAEVKDIRTIIESSGSKHARLYSAQFGNEESFKAMSGNAPEILHIATHGVFFRDRKNNTDSTMYIDNSMQRSALLFSGVENSFSMKQLPTTVDDGILCAQEIAQLDLGKVDIAVLSACETAKGELSRDGVVGLQRGFKKAGVGSIIMSLWKVDDEATCYLMSEFYKHWFGDTKKGILPMSKHDALETAKKHVRRRARWESPEYWAAFILLDGID